MAYRKLSILLVVLVLVGNGSFAKASEPFRPQHPPQRTATDAPTATVASTSTPTPVLTPTPTVTATPTLMPTATPQVTATPNGNPLVTLSTLSRAEIRQLQERLFVLGYYDIPGIDYSQELQEQRLEEYRTGRIDQPTKEGVYAFQTVAEQLSLCTAFRSLDGEMLQDQLTLLLGDQAPLASVAYSTPTPTPVPTPSPTPQPLNVINAQEHYTQPVVLQVEGQPGAAVSVTLVCAEQSATDGFTLSQTGVYEYALPTSFLEQANGLGLITVSLSADNAPAVHTDVSFWYQTSPEGGISLAQVTYTRKNQTLILQGQLSGDESYRQGAQVRLYDVVNQQSLAQYAVTDAEGMFTLPTDIIATDFSPARYALAVNNDTLHLLPLSAGSGEIKQITLFSFTESLSVTDVQIVVVVLGLFGIILLLLALLPQKKRSALPKATTVDGGGKRE